MNRPYKEFKEKWIGKNIDYDKRYGFQCVDLIKLYMEECLGMWKIGAIWNANQVPNNLKKKWFVVLWMNNLKQGDIIVRNKGTYWHIAIIDHITKKKVYVLEQNWTGKNSWSWKDWNEIRVKDYDFSFYQVILRNDDIVNNFNKEIGFVDDKIKERSELLKNTVEYRETLFFNK